MTTYATWAKNEWRRRWRRRTWRMSDEAPASDSAGGGRSKKKKKIERKKYNRQLRHTPRTDLIVFIDLSGFWPHTKRACTEAKEIASAGQRGMARKWRPPLPPKRGEKQRQGHRSYIDRQPWFLANDAAPNK